MGDVDAAGILYSAAPYRWMEELFTGWLKGVDRPVRVGAATCGAALTRLNVHPVDCRGCTDGRGLDRSGDDGGQDIAPEMSPEPAASTFVKWNEIRGCEEDFSGDSRGEDRAYPEQG
jgi:hypothetical protein